MLRPLPSARRLRHPGWQLVAASAVMVAGAYLIALWVVGVVVMVAGLLWALDAVLRDSGVPDRRDRPQAGALEQFRRAK